jgi:hypothetical protein
MSKTATLETVAEVREVKVTWQHDQDPDLSWLEQECFNDYQEGSTLPDGGVGWGMKRIEAYNRDEWFMVGIRATARIHFTTNGVSHYQDFTTPGLWGIESESGRRRGTRHAPPGSLGARSRLRGLGRGLAGQPLGRPTSGNPWAARQSGGRP